MSVMNNYRIVITDDHSLIRDGLKSIIKKESGLIIAGEAADGRELLSLLDSVKCDLIILDISMPEMDGFAAIKEINKRYPKIKVLILSMMKDYEHFRIAKRGGAAGYLAKDDARDELIAAIKTIQKGKEYVSPSLEKSLLERQVRAIGSPESPSPEILTKREIQILRLIAGGMSNKAIASRLKISIYTVKNHRANLIEKLGLSNTASLVKYALAEGLI
jgi:DNA-binding NarL/FixJ family response regulator